MKNPPMVILAGRRMVGIRKKCHGHKCPAMPMDLCVGAAAMNAVNEKRLKADLKEGLHSFDGFVSEEPGKMAVIQHGRIKGNKKVFIDNSSR